MKRMPIGRDARLLTTIFERNSDLTGLDNPAILSRAKAFTAISSVFVLLGSLTGRPRQSIVAIISPKGRQ